MKLYTCALCSDFILYTSRFEFDSHFYSAHKADRKNEITEVRTTWEPNQRMDHPLLAGARSNPPKSSCYRDQSNPELEKAGQTHPQTETQTEDEACGNDESSNHLSELIKYLLEPQQSFATEPIQYRTGPNDPIVFYNSRNSEPGQTDRQTIHPDRAHGMYDTASTSSTRQELKRRASSSKFKAFGSSTESSDEPVSKKPMMFTEDDTSRYLCEFSDFDDVEPNERASSRQRMTDRKHRQANFLDRATNKSENKSKPRSELKRRASSSTIVAASSSTETLFGDEPISKKRALRLGSTKINEDDVPRFKFFDDREPNDRKQMDDDIRKIFTSFRAPAKSPEASEASSSNETADEDDSEARPRMLNISDEMPNQDDFQASVSVADQLFSEITLREADMPTPKRLKMRRSLREIPEESEEDDTNDSFDSLCQSTKITPKRMSRPSFRETCRSRASRSSDNVSEDERTNDRASLQKQKEDDAPREADEPMSAAIIPPGDAEANVSVSSIHLLTPQKLEQMKSLMADLVSPQPEGMTSLTVNTCFINSNPADATLTDLASSRSTQNREDSLPAPVEVSASRNTTAGTSNDVASSSGGISEPKQTLEDNKLREGYEPVPKKLFLARASKEIAESIASSSSVDVSENDVTMDDLASSDEKMLTEDREESAPIFEEPYPPRGSTKTTEDSKDDDAQDPGHLKMKLLFQNGRYEVAESTTEKSTPEVNVLSPIVEVHKGDETIGCASLKTQTITRHINWINSCRAPSPSVTVNKQLLLKEASRKSAEPMSENLEAPLASQGIPEVTASRSSDKASEDDLCEAAAQPLPEETSETDDASRSSDKVPEDDQTKNRANLDEPTFETEFGAVGEPTARKISSPLTSITETESSCSSVERSDDSTTRDGIPPPVSTRTTARVYASCSSGNTFNETTIEHRKNATKRKWDRSSAGSSASVGQISSLDQSFITHPFYNNLINSYPNLIPIPQVTSSINPQYASAFGLVSVPPPPLPPPTPTALFYNYSFGNYQNPGATGINYPPVAMQNYYQPMNNLIPPPPLQQVSSQYVPPPTTAPFYNYPSGTYQNSDATKNESMQNYDQPTNNLISPEPQQVTSQYVPPPATAPFYDHPSGTSQNSDATRNSSMQDYYEPIKNLIPLAPQEPMNNLIPPAPQEPMNNLIPPAPREPMNNLIPPAPREPMNNLIPPAPQEPMNNLILPAPQEPMNNLIPPAPREPMNNLKVPTPPLPSPSTSHQDPGTQNNVAEAKAMPVRPEPVSPEPVRPEPVRTKTMGIYPCSECDTVCRSRRDWDKHKELHPQLNKKKDNNGEPPGKKRCTSQQANNKRPKDASDTSVDRGTQVRPTTSSTSMSQAAPVHPSTSSTSMNQAAPVHPSTSSASSKSIFKCGKCVQVFLSGNDLNFHIAQKHVVMRCEVCKAPFAKLPRLLAHMQIHPRYERENYSFLCDQCGFSCANTPELISHMGTHAHRQLDAQRACWQVNNENIRGKLEIQPQQQQQQQPPAAETAKPRFVCSRPRCNESFKTRTMFYVHMMIKHQHYTCYICHRGCSDQRDFNAHMELFHSDVWIKPK